MKDIVNFLFEVGILAKTPRSGFHLLGSGKQTVSEHISRTMFIGYSLALLEKEIDQLKVLKMCLLHDLSEARTSDLNYMHQKYVKTEEEKAIGELANTLPFGKDMQAVIKEFNEKKTRESILAHDADQLEFIMCLKEQMDTGNTRAETWMASSIQRLKTEKAINMAQQILKTDSDGWWFGDKKDEWWVNRNKDN